MSSGQRQTLEYAKEVTTGVTPSPFARTALPFTTTSLDAATTKEDSATILDSRLAQQGSITAIDYTGDIETEFRYGVFDDLLAGVAYNDWTANVLTFGGTKRNTLSVLRGYEDIGNYHTFRGVHVNTFGLSIPQTGIVTATFGLIGMGRTVANGTVPAGAVTKPTLPPTFSNISVTDLKIDGISEVGVACVESFEFNWDNTAQTQRCLGAGLDIGAVIATLANGTGNFVATWAVKTAARYEQQFINRLLSIEISLKDGDNNEYVLLIPKAEVTAALPSGGQQDILTATFDYRVVAEAPTLTRKPKP